MDVVWDSSQGPVGGGRSRGPRKKGSVASTCGSIGRTICSFRASKLEDMRHTKRLDRQGPKMRNEKLYAQRAKPHRDGITPHSVPTLLGRAIVRPFLSVRSLVGGFELFCLSLLRGFYVDAATSVHHGTDPVQLVDNRGFSLIRTMCAEESTDL